MSTSIPIILDGKYFEISGWILDSDERSCNNIKVKAICVPYRRNKKITEISSTLKASLNFITHLKRLHPECVSEFEVYKTQNKMPGKRLTLKSTETNLNQTKLEFVTNKDDRQTKFNTNVVNYVVNSMKPLSTVDDPNFIQMIEDLDKNVNVMSRRTLGRKIEEKYNSVRSYLKEKLKIIPFVSTTADVWSTKYRSFMGITVHWIDSKTLDRKSGVLSCRRFQGIHSYDRIADMLYEITNDFGFNHTKIISTVTNNGSNFVKAFAEFGYIADNDENETSLIDKDIDAEIAAHYIISQESVARDSSRMPASPCHQKEHHYPTIYLKSWFF